MWDDFLPTLLAWAAYRRGHEAEILAAIVGPDIEHVADMINVVLVILMTGHKHLQGIAWMPGSKILHFASRLARRNKQDESFAACALYLDVIEFVLFLVNQFIVLSTEYTTKESIGAFRHRVFLSVEDGLAIVSPRHRSNSLGRVGQYDPSPQILDMKYILAKPRRVG